MSDQGLTILPTPVLLSAFVRRDHAGSLFNGEASVRASGTLYCVRDGLTSRGRIAKETEEVARDEPEHDRFLVREKPTSYQAMQLRMALVDELRAQGYAADAHSITLSAQSARAFARGSAVPTYVRFVKEEGLS